jgi:hypothetical protein
MSLVAWLLLGSVSVDVDGEANVTVTGVAATSALGTSTTQTDNRFNVGDLVEPMVGSFPFVNPTVSGACNVTPIGVSATGIVGTTNIWQLINDSQNPNWTEIAA